MKDWTELCQSLRRCILEVGEDGGAFRIHHKHVSLNIIASFGGGWDHVSVSIHNVKRCPTWEEMCMVKDIFFEEEECVLQYHPAKSAYVNQHPFCLHMWRPQEGEVPLPPLYMV